ncbi:MAG TPA: F0F1 ATP synthase subunit epsilon, partial [Dehalococcoidia bacterium]|nr:F0F1 ATP synthase subunit epsilon [Dehalococcoidia bacterium]
MVTAEQQILSEQVDSIVVPGIDGYLGILPHHAPLMTMLQPGELIIRKGEIESDFAISGGFLEVHPEKVIILADACERSDAIDTQRAEAAMKRAEEQLKSIGPGTPEDHARAEASLRRALARLKV